MQVGNKSDLLVRIRFGEDANEFDGGPADAVVVVGERGAEVAVHGQIELLGVDFINQFRP
jgi:hypothetical protein